MGKEQRRPAKKPWITKQMIELMDQRKRWKSINTEAGHKEYRRLNNKLRRETDRARERWLTKQCEEIENLDQSGRMDIMYKKVQQLTSNKGNYNNTQVLEDKHGRMLTEAEPIKARWIEYIEDLYGKSEKPNELPLEEEQHIQIDDIGPDLLESELRAAITRLKGGKAEGEDGIPAEFIAALDKGAQREFFNICMDIYQGGKWP